MIEKLTDNHAVLLLYLAGELPEADRREVENRLSIDRQLAEELAILDGMHQSIAASMTLLDELDANRLPAESAIDAAVESINSWRFGPRPVEGFNTPHKRRIWSWVAPLSLAASILIAAIIWFDRHPTAVLSPEMAIATQPAKSTSEPATSNNNDPETNLALLQQSFDAGSDEIPRRAVRDNRREVVARDDLSDYLLKTEVSPQ